MVEETGVSVPGSVPDTVMTVSIGGTVGFFCRFCGHRLTMVTDPMSGVVDWSVDGDYGCDANPESGDDGVDNHAPVLDRPEFRRYWQGRDYRR